MNIKRIGGKIHDLIYGCEKTANGSILGYIGCSHIGISRDCPVVRKNKRGDVKIINHDFRKSIKETNCKSCLGSRVE